MSVGVSCSEERLPTVRPVRRQALDGAVQARLLAKHEGA